MGFVGGNDEGVGVGKGGTGTIMMSDVFNNFGDDVFRKSGNAKCGEGGVVGSAGRGGDGIEDGADVVGSDGGAFVVGVGAVGEGFGGFEGILVNGGGRGVDNSVGVFEGVGGNEKGVFCEVVSAAAAGAFVLTARAEMAKAQAVSVRTLTRRASSLIDSMSVSCCFALFASFISSIFS
ncbi:hypothetical protein AGMMS49990_02310 [Endomicrobiia bacterium]|nr:hypothetical protein AGMMS49990_02310 [Endomicrobiia bacterium]